MPLTLSPSRARLPYSGHLHLTLLRGPARLEVAARLGSSQPPERAWDTILELERVLQDVDGEDRHGLMESLWRTLAATAPERLGPTRGEDLCLLALSVDPQGALLSGVGLEAVQDQPQAHVLPKAPGLPETAPPSIPLPAGDYHGIPSQAAP